MTTFPCETVILKMKEIYALYNYIVICQVNKKKLVISIFSNNKRMEISVQLMPFYLTIYILYNTAPY